MASHSGRQKPALRTSLPSAYASVNAEQPVAPYPHISPEEQDRYLSGRPGATTQHLGIALQHAQQIQAQKDAEDLILDRILDLVCLPSSPSADPAAPSAEDARAFKSALGPFRPSDYDNLILERNYDQLCGYGLCPRRHRKDDAGKGSSFRFKWGGKGSGPGGRGRSMDIVPQEKIEQWCSDECAERALFIRVQLAEEPVWERRAGDTRGNDVLLLEEARAKQQPTTPTSASSSRRVKGADLTAQMSDLDIQDSERSQELAMERGDPSSFFRDGRVDVQIRENERGLHQSVNPPQPRPEDATGGSIEGYLPKEKGKHSESHEEEDMLDQI